MLEFITNLEEILQYITNEIKITSSDIKSPSSVVFIKMENIILFYFLGIE